MKGTSASSGRPKRCARRSLFQFLSIPPNSALQRISRVILVIPRRFDLLKFAKVHAVFAPSSEEMYPKGSSTLVDPGPLATMFEGAERPGHFRGVATVVLKLFNIVSPDMAFFGQKDFQQVAVIRRLIQDLNLPVRIMVCPIIREPDGLAKSSRNVYLRGEERKAALLLSRSLKKAEEMAQAGESDSQKLLEEMRKTLDSEPRVQLDYAAIVNSATLDPRPKRSPVRWRWWRHASAQFASSII